MRKKGFPRENELVICKITDINPNSVFAQLVEYEKQGMMHVSEVAGRWVRDIREFLKEGQVVVCRVIGIDAGHIYLSLKKVKEDDKVRKQNEFKRENKAEKALEMAAKGLGKNVAQMYEEVGYKLQDEFGSLLKALEMAAKNPELLRQRGVPEKWVKEISKIAAGMKIEKTHEMIIDFNLTSYKPDGINAIKNALKKAVEHGFTVRYVSAAHYQLVGSGKNAKELEEKMEATAKKICNEIRSDGEAEFSVKR
jgi:translation initiation factor 2 subunit 1